MNKEAFGVEWDGMDGIGMVILGPSVLIMISLLLDSLMNKRDDLGSPSGSRL